MRAFLQKLLKLVRRGTTDFSGWHAMSAAEIGEVLNDARYLLSLQVEPDDVLRELKSAVFYIETYGGSVTDSYTAGGNLTRVKAVIAAAELK